MQIINDLHHCHPTLSPPPARSIPTPLGRDSSTNNGPTAASPPIIKAICLWLEFKGTVPGGVIYDEFSVLFATGIRCGHGYNSGSSL